MSRRVPVAWLATLATVLGTGLVAATVLWLLVGVLRAPGVPQPGLGEAVLGSLALCGLALLVAVPAGVGTGLQLARARGRPWRVAHGLLKDLAAVPGVVYGLFGAVVFVSMLGAGLLAAGLTLGLLLVPALAVATREAVDRVPAWQREAALALGASEVAVLRRVVLPQAAGGIAAGVCRALARCAGELAPLLVVGVALFPLADREGPAAVPARLFALAAQDPVPREAFALAASLLALVVLLHVLAGRLRGQSS